MYIYTYRFLIVLFNGEEGAWVHTHVCACLCVFVCVWVGAQLAELSSYTSESQ